MAIAFVQAPTGYLNNATSTTAPLAFASNNTAGNLLVAVIGWTNSLANGPVSIADTRGNAWTICTGIYDTPNDQGCTIAYAPNCAAGANTVTVTFNATALYRRLTLAEYSGAATSTPLDKQQGNVQTTTTATDNITTGATVLPTTDGQLIVGGFQRDGNEFGGNLVAGTGFNQRQVLNSTDHMLEDKIQTTATAVSATATYAAGASSFVNYIATFKAASSGSNFTVTPTDTAGSVDTASLTQDRPGALDTSGSVDTAAILQAKPFVDNGNLVDTAAVLQGKVTVDAAGTTDSADVSLQQLTSTAHEDTAGTVDSASLVLDFGAVTVDSAGTVDTSTQTRGSGNVDAVGNTDSFTADLTVPGAATFTDTAGNVDSVAIDRWVAVTDNGAVTDTAAAAVSRSVVVTDNGATTDTFTTTLTPSVEPTDAAGATDDAVIVVTRQIVTVDDAGSADSTSRVAVYTFTQLDSSGVTDLATVILTGANIGVAVLNPGLILTMPTTSLEVIP